MDEGHYTYPVACCFLFLPFLFSNFPSSPCLDCVLAVGEHRWLAGLPCALYWTRIYIAQCTCHRADESTNRHCRAGPCCFMLCFDVLVPHHASPDLRRSAESEVPGRHNCWVLVACARLCLTQNEITKQFYAGGYGGAHLKGVVLHFCLQIGRPVTGMWQGYDFD